MHVLRLALALVLVAGACGGPPAAAREAQRRLAAGDLDGAQRIVDDELSRSPREPHLWNLRIRLFLARGDTAAAIDSYRQWRGLRGRDDDEALRALALTTIWRELSSGDAEARAAAIRISEELNDHRLYETVVRLLRDEDPVVRATAASAILRSNDDAAAVLAASLASSSPAARAIAVEALGSKVGIEAAGDLRAALSDGDARVRQAACDALGAIRDRSSAATLADVGRRDGSAQVRAAALRALARLESAAGAEAARAGLADAYLGARLAALSALDAILGDEARAELARLAAGPDRYLALRAGVALARRGDRAPGIEAVRAAASDGDWTVRAAAANAAGDVFARAELAGALGPLLTDREPGVRLAAARSLAHAGMKDQARPIFEQALSSTDELVRLEAAIDLARMGDAAGIDALSALLASPSVDVRRSAAAGFPRTRPLPDPLLAALTDPSSPVRLSAASSLLR